ncbi:hypothetical protein SLJ62_02310 [Acinetobacter pittii]|uniref:hypothetical protein n=1 Tax=Acinetobacter pittii TaxID=48296 RepID=UPI002A028A82|nr:hypothetical protein [Acinetobacter pittii]MDX8154381.1 hypothetical protein [Acinetobacter pittii]
MSNRQKDLNELYNVADIAETELMRRLSILESDEEKFPQYSGLIEALNRTLRMNSFIQKIANFLPYVQLKHIILTLHAILSKLPLDDDNLNEEKIRTYISEFHSISNELSRLTNVDFQSYYYDKKTEADLKNLLDAIEDYFKTYEIDFPSNIKELAIKVFNHELVDDKVHEKIINDLVKVFNLSKTNLDESAALLKELYLSLRETDLDLQANKFSHQVNEHTKEYKEARENLGLKENSGLIDIFKNDSENYTWPIRFYTVSIVSVFFGICYFINDKIVHFEKNQDWHLYLFFSTVILTLSGLLTFLIRERSRLIALQTYCKKYHLELTALPNYLAELSPEQARELRIELAKIYFKGYDDNAKTDGRESNISQLSSTLDQVVKSISEIKNILSK